MSDVVRMALDRKFQLFRLMMALAQRTGGFLVEAIAAKRAAELSELPECVTFANSSLANQPRNDAECQQQMCELRRDCLERELPRNKQRQSARLAKPSVSTPGNKTKGAGHTQH